MPDEITCRNYLAKQRWNGKTVCPYCGHGKCYTIEGGKRYKCASTECFKRFTVTVGTIFEASNIPLTKWFTAVYLTTAHKKGISSYQLAKDIGTTQKTGWFMLHRIREVLRVKQQSLLTDVVEIDEVYIGGKVGNMSKTKRKNLRETGNSMNTKSMVMGMLQRGGNLMLVTVPARSTNVLQTVIDNHVDKQATIITDNLHGYVPVGKEYAKHEVVNHGEMEYVRGNVHTNSVEGAFSLLKRSIIGIYHQVTPKHLSRYCDETMYRYNLRGMKDYERFTYTLTRSEARLKYKVLIAAPDNKPLMNVVSKEDNKADYIKGAHRRIVQLLDGEILGEFKNAAQAAKTLGIQATHIGKVLRGEKPSAHGYQFKYL